jgi:K+-sensing histidine kinase KdpD
MIILLFLMTNQTMTLSLTFGFKSLYNRLWLFNFYLALITAYTFSPAHDYTVLVHESSIDQVFPYIALIVIIAGLIIDRTNANRFIRSLKELQSARSAQNYFGASFGLITHNIRTPLAAIQNRLNILRLTQVKSDKEETTALDLALNKMEKDVSYISSTLESLITNFKATALKVNDTTPLSDFISDSADQYKPNLIINSEDRNESSLVLNQSEQFTLGIAVQCFVDNSRKYAKSPVHVSYSNRSISFQDSGNGFPENIIKTQGEDIVHSSTGHGIGLHLTRKLLGANEWTMTISNNATGGRIVLEKL